MNHKPEPKIHTAKGLRIGYPEIYNMEFKTLQRNTQNADENMKGKITLESLETKINRLKSNAGYLFAGSPWYLGLFGRDSLIASWQLLEYDQSIAKNTLLILAKMQGTRKDPSTQEEPGKILHEYYPPDTPKKWFDKYKRPVKWLEIDRAEYLSVDSTPLFLIVLAKYYQKSGDLDTLSKLWPNAKAAAEWIVQYGFKGKFVGYTANKEKLKTQCWKDGIGKALDDAVGPVYAVEVQGYSYLALKETSILAEIMNDSNFSKKLHERAWLLKKDFDKAFWMEDMQSYALALDGNMSQIKFVTSNPGHLLFTDILNAKQSESVAKRLFKHDMYTPYGIRTHSINEPNFDEFAYQLGSIWPHDNWIIATGLSHLGYIKEYQKIRTALIKAADDLGTMPEYFGVFKDNKLIPYNKMKVEPCDSQAWSIGALLNLLLSK